eukprot:tig00021135_g18960.t1
MAGPVAGSASGRMNIHNLNSNYIVVPLEDTVVEGVVDGLLHYLCRRDEEGNCCPGVNVPDTIFYKYRTAAYWFYMGPDGIDIKRKQEMQLQLMEKTFSKPSHPDCEIVSYHIGTSETNAGEVTSIEYFDVPLMRDFFNVTDRYGYGMLQHFIVPAGNRNSVIRVIWSANIFIAERRSNVHSLTDRKVPMFDRATTFEAAWHLSETAPVASPSLRHNLLQICDNIHAHVYRVSPQRYKITRMVMNFKQDAQGNLWFLWCSSIRLEKPGGSDGPRLPLSLQALYQMPKGDRRKKKAGARPKGPARPAPKPREAGEVDAEPAGLEGGKGEEGEGPPPPPRSESPAPPALPPPARSESPALHSDREPRTPPRAPSRERGERTPSRAQSRGDGAGTARSVRRRPSGSPTPGEILAEAVASVDLSYPVVAPVDIYKTTQGKSPLALRNFGATSVARTFTLCPDCRRTMPSHEMTQRVTYASFIEFFERPARHRARTPASPSASARGAGLAGLFTEAGAGSARGRPASRSGASGSPPMSPERASEPAAVAAWYARHAGCLGSSTPDEAARAKGPPASPPSWPPATPPARTSPPRTPPSPAPCPAPAPPAPCPRPAAPPPRTAAPPTPTPTRATRSAPPALSRRCEPAPRPPAGPRRRPAPPRRAGRLGERGSLRGRPPRGPPRGLGRGGPEAHLDETRDLERMGAIPALLRPPPARKLVSPSPSPSSSSPPTSPPAASRPRPTAAGARAPSGARSSAPPPARSAASGCARPWTGARAPEEPPVPRAPRRPRGKAGPKRGPAAAPRSAVRRAAATRARTRRGSRSGRVRGRFRGEGEEAEETYEADDFEPLEPEPEVPPSPPGPPAPLTGAAAASAAAAGRLAALGQPASVGQVSPPTAPPRPAARRRRPTGRQPVEREGPAAVEGGPGRGRRRGQGRAPLALLGPPELALAGRRPGRRRPAAPQRACQGRAAGPAGALDGGRGGPRGPASPGGEWPPQGPHTEAAHTQRAPSEEPEEEGQRAAEMPPVVRLLHPNLTLALYRQLKSNPDFVSTTVKVCDDCMLKFTDSTMGVLAQELQETSVPLYGPPPVPSSRIVARVAGYGHSGPSPLSARQRTALRAALSPDEAPPEGGPASPTGSARARPLSRAQSRSPSRRASGAEAEGGDTLGAPHPHSGLLQPLPPAAAGAPGQPPLEPEEDPFNFTGVSAISSMTGASEAAALKASSESLRALLDRAAAVAVAAASSNTGAGGGGVRAARAAAAARRASGPQQQQQADSPAGKAEAGRGRRLAGAQAKRQRRQQKLLEEQRWEAQKEAMRALAKQFSSRAELDSARGPFEGLPASPAPWTAPPRRPQPRRPRGPGADAATPPARLCRAQGGTRARAQVTREQIAQLLFSSPYVHQLASAVLREYTAGTKINLGAIDPSDRGLPPPGGLPGGARRGLPPRPPSRTAPGRA